MNRLDAQLVVHELDDERHDRRSAGVVDAGCPPFVAIVDRGLETVVAVGEDQPVRIDRRADRGDRGRVVDGTEFVTHAVGIGARAQRPRPLGQLGEAGAERERPDRIDVDPHLAQQREPVRFGLGQRAFVRQDVVAARLRQAERADHTAGVPAAVLHPVGVETSGAVDNEDPVAHPRREHRRGPGVAVAVGVLVARRISRTELQSCTASSAACSSSSTTS